jgi:hypothetical protein
MEHKSSSSGGGDAGFETGLSFYTNGGGASDTDPTERMRIDSSGNVGIGTSSPSSFTSASAQNLVVGSGSGNTGMTVYSGATSVGGLAFADGTASGSHYRGLLQYSHSSDAMLLYTSETERMRIDSSGNVVIGGTDAAYGKFSVRNGYAYINEDGANTKQLYLRSDLGGDPAIQVATNHALGFRTNNTEAMRIDSSGNLLVGKSVTTFANNGIALRSSGETNITRNNGVPLYIRRNTSDGGIVRFWKDGTTVGSIGTNSSNAYISGTTRGLHFTGTAGIIPCNETGAARDADTDLGTSSTRFKDLYLSGIAYANYVGSSGDTDTIIAFDTANTVRVVTAGSEAMRIDSSGNLLVGKTAANTATAGVEARSSGLFSASRDGNTAAYFNRITSDGDIVGFLKDGSTVGSIGTFAGDFVIGSSSGSDAAFRMDGTNNAIYASNTSGNARDAAIDLGASTVRWKDLYLSGAMYGGGVTSSSDTTSHSSGNAFSGTSSYANWTSWGTGTHTHASFRNGTSQVGYIQTNTTATTYSTSSDYRLKTDAQPMTGATDRLKQLNPVNFEWIADGTRVDGFLAHEAQAVVPEAVTGTKDAMRDEEYEVTPAVYDEDGNVVTEAVMGTRSVPDYQGIDQSKLVPLLVATIKELEARITALENG